MSRITGAFDDLTVAVVARAYAETCSRLPAVTSPTERDLLAKRILGTAALGERDPAKMRDDAIAYIHGD